MKRCNKCAIEQPIDQFRVVTTRKSYGTYKYRRNQCKACVKIANKKYYDANRRKRIDAALKWARENPERRKAYQDQYREDNRDYYRRQYRKRYWADPERFREESRKRRLRLQGIKVGDYIKADILARDNYTCHVCKRTMEARDLTIDHLIPLSKNGPDTEENVAAACFSCNIRRNDGRHSKYRPE